MKGVRMIIFIGCLFSLYFTGCASIKISPQQDLLPGESVIYNKTVNGQIIFNEETLSRYSSGQLWWLLYMSIKNPIEGQIYLTNYRLIFKSNDMSSDAGKFSIFLPTIERTEDISFFINRTVSIYTEDYLQFEFILWGGVPEFIAAIKEQKNKITAPELAALKKLAISNISIIGDGLKLKPESGQFHADLCQTMT